MPGTRISFRLFFVYYLTLFIGTDENIYARVNSVYAFACVCVCVKVCKRAIDFYDLFIRSHSRNGSLGKHYPNVVAATTTTTSFVAVGVRADILA